MSYEFQPSPLPSDASDARGCPLTYQMLKRGLALVAAPALLIPPCIAAPGGLGNLSPAEALDAFETEPGFVVELAAAEPLTIDPVALAFDERGRLYVAEDRDYPLGAPDGRPLGVVALLEDTDGDGVLDKRTDFATGIKFPNGVMPWRGGVIVTASPEVWWLADTNGDGVADVRKVLLTGLATDSTSQLRANDPTLGPDGWVYLAGGLRGGNVLCPQRPSVTLSLEKCDMRFKPDTGEMELTEGKSQFGLAFDEAGNRFACMNRIQSQHAPLPARYLARNPYVISPGALQDCPAIAANLLMTRYTAGAARYYPISDNITTADSHFGTYSAACAVHVYRGESLPPEYRGAAFSCDPTGNLVRGDRLETVGGTFAARRIHEGTEALRSRDNWFRPVFLADGPDGALYIADMYRKVIEHPEYLPGEVRKHMDFDAGKDKGRIWRLRGSAGGRASAAAPGRTVGFAAATTAELVQELASPIPWRRDTAHRLLVERHDPDAVPLLMRAFTLSTRTGPAVIELQLLHSLGALTEAILEPALTHPEPGVRQTALRLAEPRLATSPRLRALVLACAGDPHPHVRFQAALTLGEIGNDSVIPALGRIAASQADDRWTRAAILSSLRDGEAAFAVLADLAHRPSSGEGMQALVGELGRRLGSGLPAERIAVTFEHLLELTAKPAGELRLAAVLGFFEAAPESSRALAQAHAPELQALWAETLRLARDGQVPAERRVRALRLLTHDEGAATGEVLLELVAADNSIEVQTAAARALVQPMRALLAPRLVQPEAWTSYTPGLRTVLVAAMAAQPRFVAALLDAIEAGAIPVGALTPAQRDQLRKARDEALRTRAEKLLAAPGGDREAAFQEAKAALKLKPDPQNGHAVFLKQCTVCHRLNQEGVAVGPDLFDIRNQPKEAILYHIIIPEAEVAPHFANYECETRDGRLLSGLLASESGATITLRMAQGVEETVPRASIVRLEASRLSLMPQEFERLMTLQELADLLGYLRGEQ